MCGINGFYCIEPASVEKNLNILNSMNKKIVHRGPDDEGFYADEHVALGMRRLSIIDLSTGSQPIFNEDGSMLIVFNGEIYNFIELRNDLIAKGHAFKTKADTEVILHAYEEYGEKFLKIIDGMFAFAIYDKGKRELFIARDRAGEKPLYYYHDDSIFIFCSELKSIINTFDFRKEIDKTALNQYLSLTYIPAPLTIFKGIYKLEAGFFIKFSEEGFTREQYWDVPISLRHNMIRSYDEYKNKLKSSLFLSVERKMVSDVPLGAFLSGGIDSSIIIGIMSQISKRPVETFTIGFKNKEFDESGRAKIVSDYYKTNHHLYYLDYSDAVNCLDNIIDSLDEPFADSSAIPTYFVSRYAADYVKVVLTGDAGDELFGGYSKYLIDYYAGRYKQIPHFLRKYFIEEIITLMPDRSAFTRKAKKVIYNSDGDMFEKRQALMMLGFNDSARASLLSNDANSAESLDFIRLFYQKEPGIDELTKTLYTDFKVVLEGDMLVKVDRMSMLNSLETRVPLLDPRVIESAFSMPPDFKIRGKEQKYIFKDTFKDLLPRGITRKSKKGFAVPIGQWLKGPLKAELESLLSEEILENQGIFNYHAVKTLMEDHFSERSNNYSQLWTLFIFQKWFRHYFNG